MEYSVVEKNNFAIVKLIGELDVASSIHMRDVSLCKTPFRYREGNSAVEIFVYGAFEL